MFILDRPNSKEPTHIFLFITLSDGRLKYPSKEKILPEDFPKLWIKNVPKKFVPLRSVLSRIEDTVQQARDSARITGKPLTRESLRAMLDEKLKRSKPYNGKTNFYDGTKVIIDQMENGDILNERGNRYAPGTIPKMRNARERLKLFDEDMTFEAVTLKTYNEFIVWCNSKGYSRNYTGTLIISWKSLLSLSLKKGIHQNKIYESPEFKKLFEDVTDIALTPDELQSIVEVDLTDTLQSTARAWFVIGCYTALRVSDLLSLDPKNISDETITFVTDKTDTKVVIPIHPAVKKILKKYKGLPPKITDVEINREIKQVARRVKINTKVIYSLTEGGTRKDHYYQKWQLVSTHTMRRTFITNARSSGIPDSIVMKIAGIVSIKTLQKYDKLTPEKAAEMAAEMKFFK